MLFEFTRRPGAPSPLTGEKTFQVGRVRRHASGAVVDVSHLFDRSYGYHSPRELRWHIADRFGVVPQTVSLQEGH